MFLKRPERNFVAKDFTIEKWEDVEKYLIDLETREIASKQEFERWLKDQSELEAILEENLAWRYIRMTINTRDKALTDDYTFFVKEIQPKLSPYSFRLNKKLSESPFKKEFNAEAYKIYFRSVDTAIKLFREENIPLEAEMAEKSQQFGAISGAQSISHDGKEITMQKAASLLKENDETLRKNIFEKMVARRQEDAEKLDKLFTELIRIRHRIALNAGFDNYRDYKFAALGRFDYTKEDCFDFHRSIKKEIVPLVKQINEKQAELLKKDKLKPWDSEVDPKGRKPLKPFETGKELLDRTIAMFNGIDPYFGDCLSTMEKMGHLDLESKEGKSPGGYNYPLYEIGVPFIFMNAVGSHRDLITMVHEGGHAVHSFLSRDLEITGFKSLPSEVAELSSMSMELLTMDYWGAFYSEEEDLKRAKTEQLETILKILPWIATIDEFQHWIYENPSHTVKERHAKWIDILKAYGTGVTDWTGYESAREIIWQKQLHLFEVPFYYIEYGMAQLGALAVWKNSKSDFKKAITDYKKALSLGYTKSIPEVYRTAGITFDFSLGNIQSLVRFVKQEMEAIEG
ncbi:MAG: M3 family oligoendopeptidase [Brumimicrobium sp.]|nr:M3 family oligoendopeptidase [Brumimicrobium sp.]